MKKASLFLVVLIGASTVAVPQHYLRQYNRFKTMLIGYKQCILRQRACTSQEKKTLGVVVGTLVTFAIALAGAFGYKWYQEQMALSWNGIMRMIDSFDADVRSEFPTGHVVTFNMRTLEKFQHAIQTRPLSLLEQKKMKDDIDAMVTGVGGKQGRLQLLIAFVQQQMKPTYKSLEQTFTENLTDFADIDPKKVYEYLNLDQNKGIALSALQMKDHIEKNVSDQKRKRQLDYIFANDMQKKLYDAYVRGEHAVQALPEVVSIAQIAAQIGFITELIAALSTLAS